MILTKQMIKVPNTLIFLRSFMFLKVMHRLNNVRWLKELIKIMIKMP
jgi:hypothetical protein